MPAEGERVPIFLRESDVMALNAEVGDRGMSPRIREILKEVTKCLKQHEKC